jgi:hypothetical protein
VSNDGHGKGLYVPIWIFGHCSVRRGCGQFGVQDGELGNGSRGTSQARKQKATVENLRLDAQNYPQDQEY